MVTHRPVARPMSTADAAASTACACTYIRLYTYIMLYCTCTVGYLLATDWVVWGSNPDGGEIFRTRLGRPWGPPSLLYNRYRVSPGGKPAGARRDVDHPPHLAPRLRKE
jgi:hypothetical protein